MPKTTSTSHTIHTLSHSNFHRLNIPKSEPSLIFVHYAISKYVLRLCSLVSTRNIEKGNIFCTWNEQKMYRTALNYVSHSMMVTDFKGSSHHWIFSSFFLCVICVPSNKPGRKNWKSSGFLHGLAASVHWNGTKKFKHRCYCVDPLTFVLFQKIFNQKFRRFSIKHCDLIYQSAALIREGKLPSSFLLRKGKAANHVSRTVSIITLQSLHEDQHRCSCFFSLLSKQRLSASCSYWKEPAVGVAAE